MTDKLTQFDYLLNAVELAGQHNNPAEHGYGEKRRALFAHVRELERLAALAAPPPDAGLVALVAEVQTSCVNLRGYDPALDVLLAYPLPSPPQEPT